MTTDAEPRIVRIVMARRFVVIAVACGVALRIAWIAWTFSMGAAPASDAAWYYARAASIAAGDGYAVQGVPTAYWPVGYPAFLGSLFTVFGVSPVVGAAANVLLAIGTMVLVYRIARRLLANELAARLALVIAAVYPNHVAYSSLLLSEPLALFVLLAGTLLLLDADGPISTVVVAGVLFGAATLVKPQLLLVPACLLIALRWARGRGSARPGLPVRGAVVYAALLVVVVPWTLRNHSVFGHHGIISNNDGINLYIGNNPRATGGYLLDDEMEGTYHDGSDEYLWNARARSAALDYVAAQPLEVLGRLPRKLWYLYRADAEGFSINIRGIPANEDDGFDPMIVLKFIAQGWWVMLAACFLVSLPALVRRARRRSMPERETLAVAGAMLVLFTAIPLVYFGDGRFHYPVIPWLVICGAYYLSNVVKPAHRTDAGAGVAGAHSHT